MGFDTTFAGLPARPKTASPLPPMVLLEDNLAEQSMIVTLACIRTRCMSMSWHSSSWPGQLALLLSPQQRHHDQALSALRLDFCAFIEAKEHAADSRFVAKMVQSSPFSTVLMAEAAELLLTPCLRTVDVIVRELHDFACAIFQGVCTTKPVEDLFKLLRERACPGMS